ncbi:hypothetical protein AURDEDRAFT_144549 [Auricularia subglabra TFB-10046 SS5]|nr:hypothetical protein AURDEDRAFT_144549 [Auricularia subglabra TFB-10046 SS5]
MDQSAITANTTQRAPSTTRSEVQPVPVLAEHGADMGAEWSGISHKGASSEQCCLSTVKTLHLTRAALRSLSSHSTTTVTRVSGRRRWPWVLRE